MNNIQFLLIIVIFLASTLVGVRSQTNSLPQWHQGSPSDFTNTIVYTTEGDFSGKHYEASIYGRDLNDVPKWKVGKELPIGIPTIIADAVGAFKKAFPTFTQFKIVSVNLVHLPAVDDWIFDLEFNGTDFAQLGMGSYEAKKINALVLLNGRVITPQ
jgi:hypothetical protein